MVLIVDTNIFIYGSGAKPAKTKEEAKKQSDCSRFLEKIATVGCDHIIEFSQEIENEYFNSKSGQRDKVVQKYVSNILYRRLAVESPQRIKKHDPSALPTNVLQALRTFNFHDDDDKFVQLAIDEKIKLIVSEDTGDYSLIKDYLSRNYGIDILTAAAALEKLF